MMYACNSARTPESVAMSADSKQLQFINTTNIAYPVCPKFDHKFKSFCWILHCLCRRIMMTFLGLKSFYSLSFVSV